MTRQTPNARPFLKWAGGKRQLLEHIRPLIPASYDRLIEPFMGGAAVFFDQQPETGWLNDINTELVNCYQMVRDEVTALIEDLGRHPYERSYFEEIRALDRQPGGLSALPALTRASRFIYLNKTSFNGLYRVNSKGFYNVPFGRFKNPTIVNADLLRACSKALQGCRITNQDWQDVVQAARPGDFVYLDPPYLPLSETSNFTHYADSGFGLADQQALARATADLARRGIGFVASNSWHPDILKLYQDFTIKEVAASRAINARASGRKPIAEALITNLL